ncbi:MAG: 5-deoxy-glucuronate isomerase [Spirochaetaceae bacterium]|nr:MAG: 5-deoxy-glucuronate isomerase [Spirochaetaceae bacterium]
MLMDFGILKLGPGDSWSNNDEKERAFLLMTGHVWFEWSRGDESGGEEVVRISLLDEEPTALHVPAGAVVTISSVEGTAELAIQQVRNSRVFPSRLWKPGEYRSDRFGEGTLQDTSTRTVRTIFDAATAPESEMVLGEVINHPGKWSSYPPHDHAQPEVYHYRFFPEHGFGHAEREDEVFKVRNYDSYAIPPGVTHSQCAAPGYAMYYIWMIPHLPNDRFGPDSRIFRGEHTWVMDGSAPIWPDTDLATVLEYQRRLSGNG